MIICRGINKLILASPLSFLKKAAKAFPLTFSMEHLLHRLYGVDAPACNCPPDSACPRVL